MPHLQPNDRSQFCWIAAGVIVIVASFLLPVEGVKGTECISKTLTDHPCPGCGVTRSITAISHGDVRKAWGFNPLGFVIYAALMILTLSLVPSVRRRVLSPLLMAYQAPRKWVWLTVVTIIILFGISRALYGTWWLPGFVPPKPA